jgi:hypothetical protein
MLSAKWMAASNAVDASRDVRGHPRGFQKAKGFGVRQWVERQTSEEPLPSRRRSPRGRRRITARDRDPRIHRKRRNKHLPNPCVEKDEHLVGVQRDDYLFVKRRKPLNRVFHRGQALA